MQFVIMAENSLAKMGKSCTRNLGNGSNQFRRTKMAEFDT